MIVASLEPGHYLYHRWSIVRSTLFMNQWWSIVMKHVGVTWPWWIHTENELLVDKDLELVRKMFLCRIQENPTIGMKMVCLNYISRFECINWCYTREGAGRWIYKSIEWCSSTSHTQYGNSIYNTLDNDIAIYRAAMSLHMITPSALIWFMNVYFLIMSHILHRHPARIGKI